MASCFPVLATNVFEEGDIQWKILKVESSPKPLLVFAPTEAGTYPVILFCHGYAIRNSFYSKLLGHIASHGFIIVAPHLFCSSMIPMLGSCEVKYVGKVIDWMAEGLKPWLPPKVEAKLESIILMGHSRGGKTAFAVALDHVQTKLNFSVLIGIDPVAGPTKCKITQTFPKILTGVPRSFNLGIPVAVIGTGLGPEPNSYTRMACAPDGMNHEEFYRECKPPCAHFVAKEYGHMDMLDDEIPGLIGGIMSKCICKNGLGPRDLMRRTVGGLVVAFLRAHLKGLWEDFHAILKDPTLSPAKLDPAQYAKV
ncbi:hypothetical protein PIB30_043745 [Stylosanthes scabra]|uniref:Chlorophyllase n=1 Tax=Stylosanthes scabra TaxID=79078 RepID=A0ABU6XFY5_9FABA|nr:hypothetical protein [Stylosanthes scabra]